MVRTLPQTPGYPADIAQTVGTALPQISAGLGPPWYLGLMRLRKLTIERYRNVEPGTELTFDDEINVVLGLNATGKTTLLNLIAAITSDDFSLLEQDPDGFDMAWEFTLGPVGVENGSVCAARLTRTPRTAADGAVGDGHDVGVDEHRPASWAVSACMELKVGNESKGVLEAKGIARDPSAPHLSFTFDQQPLLNDAGHGGPLCLQLLLSVYQDAGEPSHEGWNGWSLELDNAWDTRRFDEALACFESLLHRPITLAQRNDNPTRVWAMRGGLSRLGEWPRKLPSRAPVELKNFGPTRDEGSIAGLLGFTRVDVAPNIVKVDEVRGVRTFEIDRLNFHFHQGENYISEERLSFGQKRMFALQYYLQVRRAPYVLDEPANGLHYEWIRRLFHDIEGRQTFLATQHPFLLDIVPVFSEESVHKGFIRCSTHAGQLRWRNFSAEEAKDFIQAYDVGIQQVSEILREKELW